MIYIMKRMKNKKESFAFAFKFLDSVEKVRIKRLDWLFKNLDRGRESTADELNKIGYN